MCCNTTDFAVLAVFFALTWVALITLLVTFLVLVKLKVIAVKVLRKPRLPSFLTLPSCRICEPVMQKLAQCSDYARTHLNEHVLSHVRRAANPVQNTAASRERTGACNNVAYATRQGEESDINLSNPVYSSVDLNTDANTNPSGPVHVGLTDTSVALPPQACAVNKADQVKEGPHVQRLYTAPVRGSKPTVAPRPMIIKETTSKVEITHSLPSSTRQPRKPTEAYEQLDI